MLNTPQCHIVLLMFIGQKNSLGFMLIFLLLQHGTSNDNITGLNPTNIHQFNKELSQDLHM